MVTTLRTARTIADPYACPSDYAELYRNYFGYVCYFVIKQGIEPQSAEDVAGDILIRFFERDFLAAYNPDLVFEREGTFRKARFQSFLNAFVIAYVKHHRARQSTQRVREPIICDSPVGEEGVSWVKVFGPAAPDHYGPLEDKLEEEETVRRIAAHLRTVPRRSPKDIADMPRLFECVVAQARLKGKTDTKELQAVFGVSSSAIGSWLKLLRGHVADALAADRVGTDGYVVHKSVVRYLEKSQSASEA